MKYFLFLPACFLVMTRAHAQNKTTPAQASDSIMITVFLKHQEDKNLDSINSILARNKFIDKFPPKSGRVISCM